MELQQLVEQFLKGNKHMQLATLHDGRPWLCTVYYAFDDDYNLHWMSARERGHSRDIITDSRVAVTVLNDPERKQALQMVGEASEVADDQIERAHELYTAKFGPKEYDLETMKLHHPEGRAYWMFRPSEIWLWDEVDFPDAPKQQFRAEA